MRTAEELNLDRRSNPSLLVSAYLKGNGSQAMSIIQNEGEQLSKEDEFDKLIKKGDTQMKTSFMIGPPPNDQMKVSVGEQSRSNKISYKNSGTTNSPKKADSKKSGRSSSRYENDTPNVEVISKPKMPAGKKKRKEKSQEPSKAFNAFSLGIGGELEPIKEHQDEILKSH